MPIILMALDVVLRTGRFLIFFKSPLRDIWLPHDEVSEFYMWKCCPSYSLPRAGEKTARNPYFGSCAKALPLQ